MNEKTLNLIDEAWVRVMMPDCSVREVSLMDALTKAHLYRGLAGEMETQNIAVLRLLIAVVHTVFSRMDMEGRECLIEDRKTALERWGTLMRNGSFPENPVRNYLTAWRDRFWLFHPIRPFYQAPAAGNGTINSAAKLNGEVSKSENKERLFSSVSGEGKTGMSLAESARWLLFINGFDDCAAKQKDKSSGSRSMSVAWLGKLGLVTAVGSSLFETILMNMPMLNDLGEPWAEDKPVWEADAVCEEERRTIVMPQDLAGILTLQSRRILLKKDGDRVVSYGILGGDAFSEQNAKREPMTIWKIIEDKKTGASFYVPSRHNRSRQVWREFGAMVNTGEKEFRPGIVSWCETLQRNALIDPRRVLTFRIGCVRYDSSQFSSITDSFSDALSFHADLLIEKDSAWIREINLQVGLIDKASDEVGRLAYNLAKACGQSDDQQKSESSHAKEMYYQSIDLSFREWLMKLTSGQEFEERGALILEWQKYARQVAMTLGNRLVEEKGNTAFIGRMVKEKKTEKHYSSPEAFYWFKLHLASIYPYVQEGEEQDGEIKS